VQGEWAEVVPVPQYMRHPVTGDAAPAAGAVGNKI